MRLDGLRRDFPTVPLMALTATANEKVVNDAIQALGMRKEYRYKSSFNRANLQYEVRPKDGTTLDQIVEYICAHPKESGVVYCLSRKDCERTSETLQQKARMRIPNIRIDYYHAELEAGERQRRHREWSNGHVSVLCATVAFGMGIDKPDVRYVIHYSMPKSITHYYQESGRAGRDGETAHCILFYHYKDKKILENLIVKGSNNRNSTRRQVDQLYSCVRYCEDLFTCRRTLQLDFFGEQFSAEQCRGTCDNCKAARVPDRRNLTTVAQDLLRMLEHQQKMTLTQLMEVYRGSKSKSVARFSNVVGHGKGSRYKRHELDRIAHAMIFDHVLVERGQANQGGFTTDYVYHGESAPAVMNNRRDFFVNFPQATTAKKKKAAAKKTPAKKKAAKMKKTSKTTSTTSTSSARADSSSVVLVPSSDEDNDDEVLLSPATTRTKRAPSLLPQEATQKLVDQIKTLAQNWSEEERMIGNNIFYWHILSNSAMKSIASQLPTNLAELRALGELGEQIIKDYGPRLVRVVQAYVEANGLQGLVKSRKKPKVVNLLDDEEDEFGDAIDLTAVEDPMVPYQKKSASKQTTGKRSKFFGGSN